MVVEIRRLDDKIALYTDEREIYNNFAKRAEALYSIPYIQGKNVIGVDIYFKDKDESIIKNLLNGQYMMDI